MENPEHEIRHVVRSLCQGTPDEQRRTLDRYFTPDAEFVHPFCIAPSFRVGDLGLPGLRRLRSRDVIRGIFQWYRMMSPNILIEVDAVLLDKQRSRIYLDMHQTFSIWFAPAYHAHVRLVTVLDLVPCDLNAHDNGEPLVISHATPAGWKHAVGRQLVWRIARQEDLYQVNELLKFTAPYWWCLWRPLCFFLQVAATALCVFMSLFVAVSPWAWQRDPAPGGMESCISQQVEPYHDDVVSEKSSADKIVVALAPPPPPPTPAAAGESGGTASGECEDGQTGLWRAGTNGNNSNREANSSKASSPSRQPCEAGSKVGGGGRRQTNNHPPS